jgi:hypothetical protein
MSDSSGSPQEIENENPDGVDYVDVDVRAWVEASKSNPVLYRDRQVTEIVLATIGIAPIAQGYPRSEGRHSHGVGLQE